MPYCASPTTLYENIELENVVIEVYHAFLNFATPSAHFILIDIAAARATCRCSQVS